MQPLTTKIGRKCNIRVQWKIKVKIVSYNPVSATKDFIEQSLELAGIRFGILSHRPEFGRFTVKSFKQLK